LFTGTTAKPELDSEDEDDEPRQRGLARTRSRYAPAKPERDVSAIVYSIVLFTLVLFFTTVVGGTVAIKMGWVDRRVLTTLLATLDSHQL
jgi:hypothetical protein